MVESFEDAIRERRGMTAKGKRRGPGRGLEALLNDVQGPATDARQGATTDMTHAGPGLDGYEDKAAVCLHRLTRKPFGETVADVAPAIHTLDELRGVLLQAARERVEADGRSAQTARESALATIDRLEGGGAVKRRPLSPGSGSNRPGEGTRGGAGTLAPCRRRPADGGRGYF
jgi:hypothetical protein